MRRIRRSDAVRKEKLDRLLYKSASQGGVEAVKQCLADGASMTSLGPLGTPLHAAAASGFLDVANLLLDAGAPANTLGDTNYAPLHLTIRYDHVDVAIMLMNYGANLDITSKFERRTPLHIASHWNREDLATLLMEKKAHVDSRDLYGNTPLHMACRIGHIAMIENLIIHGADTNMYDNDGWSAMHFSASEGHEEIVKLLASNKSGLDQQNKHGRTPLHWACLRNHVGTVEVLLALGANLLIKDRVDRLAKDLTTSPPVTQILTLYEENLQGDGTETVTPLDLQMTLKPFIRQVSRMESARKGKDYTSTDTTDLSPTSPEVAQCLTSVFGHDILKLVEECFGQPTDIAKTQRHKTRQKYKQFLMAVGTLLSLTSHQIDTLYNTVQEALHQKSQIQIMDVLKVIFEKLQSVEDHLADFQREITAEVRTLTVSLQEVIDECTEESPNIATSQMSLNSRSLLFKQGHFLGKVAFYISNHKDCWRCLVPKLNPHLTAGNAKEFTMRIAAQSKREMDRTYMVLLSWQILQLPGSPVDTDTLLEIVQTLDVDGLEVQIQECIDEYHNMTPLIHLHSSIPSTVAPPGDDSSTSRTGIQKEAPHFLHLESIPEALSSGNVAD